MREHCDCDECSRGHWSASECAALSGGSVTEVIRQRTDLMEHAANDGLMRCARSPSGCLRAGPAVASACRRSQARRRTQEQVDRGQRLPRRQDQGRPGAGGRLPRRGQEVARQERRRCRQGDEGGPAILQATAAGRSNANTASAPWSPTAMSASCATTTWTPTARIPTPTSTPSCGTRPRTSASASAPSSPKPPTTARP